MEAPGDEERVADDRRAVGREPAMDTRSPATPCVESREKIKGMEEGRNVDSSCCGELGNQLAVNEGIVERLQGRAQLPLWTRT